MNLKWLKQNALMAGIAAAFLVVLGVLIWLQQSAASKRAEVDAALQEQESQLDHFYKQKPTPSRESIEVIKRDREQVAQLYTELLGSVSHTIEVPPDLRPVGFLQLMASTFSRLRQAAAAAGIKLQEGFAFGFGMYAGTSSTLPAKNLSPADTQRVLTLLVKQLTTIEQISNLLIANHAEIAQIRRAQVDPSAAGGSGLEMLEGAARNDPHALYQVLPFEFEFKCSEDALHSFLNSLAKTDLFLVPRRLQVSVATATTERPTTPPAIGPTGVATATPTGPKAPELSVIMRIDLIEFPKPQPARNETRKPGA
jgi:hypothetical protein